MFKTYLFYLFKREYIHVALKSKQHKEVDSAGFRSHLCPYLSPPHMALCPLATTPPFSCVCFQSFFMQTQVNININSYLPFFTKKKTLYGFYFSHL